MDEFTKEKGADYAAKTAAGSLSTGEPDMQQNTMTGIYFSGTGNSRYASETFCKKIGDVPVYILKWNDQLVMSYRRMYNISISAKYFTALRIIY